MKSNPLTAEEMQAWRAFHRVRNAVVSHMAKHLSEHTGLSEPEFLVLVPLLDARKGAVRARTLARLLFWEPSRLSHQIKRMEASGLLIREPCPEDARSFQVSLSPQGRELIEVALPLQYAEVKRSFANALTPQQLASLMEISDVLVKHLETC